MNFRTTVIAAGVIAFMPFAASAATLLENQGLTSAGGAVAPDRSLLSSVTDGDPNTFFSLGIGGTLSADVSPLAIASGSVVEVTFDNIDTYPESAQVWLGGSWTGSAWDWTGAILLGELFNVASGQATSSTGVNGSSVSQVTNTTTGLTTYFISLGSNVGSLLTLLDTTLVNFASAYDDPGEPVSDGFDAGEFRVTPVPVPAAGFLLLAGLGGLAALKRRKAA
jgi:hypothetical protein